MLPSTFEVLGPVMVGPSSSHTAGALRIAEIAAAIAPRPIKEATFFLFNSFSETYKGHGTDKALVAGILGIRTSDEKVADSFLLAKQEGLKYHFIPCGEDIGFHPNTVEIMMELEGGTTITMRGESRGGGKVRLVGIDGVDLKVRGEYPTLILLHEDLKGSLTEITGTLAKADINIASLNLYRAPVTKKCYTVIESDQKISQATADAVRALPYVSWAERLTIPGESPAPLNTTLTIDFNTCQGLLDLCHAHGCDIATIMKERELELSDSREEVEKKMETVRRVMAHSIEETIKHPRRSLGGYLDGQAKSVFGKTIGKKADRDSDIQDVLMGRRQTCAVAYAMAVLELSACMGVIVAAPTAGSSGVVPGCFWALTKDPSLLEKGLYTAAAIGAIIMNNASVAGAEGGCQAEVGSASAMAAAGLVAMLGGSPEVCFDAASIAIGNLLGLVCDPVGGLVEYPCQNRNAIGVANAYSAAQLALSGVSSPIPLDEVIEAQNTVGHLLPEALRETAKGGLAICPSVCDGCAQPCV